jgi:hypothetical protein
MMLHREASLMDAIAAFGATDEALRCATADGAFNECWRVNGRFVEYCRKMGLRAELWKGIGYLGDPRHIHGRRLLAEDVHPRTWTHYVAVVEDMVVDWTARQHDPSLPWPRLALPPDLCQEWDEVTCWVGADDVVFPHGSP